MSRLPPLPRDQLNSAQQDAYDQLTKIGEEAFGSNGSTFIYKDSTGAFVGPFQFFLEAPHIGVAVMKLVYDLSKLPLSSDAKETAILASGAHFKAPYELYAHGEVAHKSAGLSQQQVDAIKAGKKPDDLNEKCSIAFDVSYRLSSTPGPLPAELWKRAIETLGKEATVALIHYVGLYAYTCVVLNACDVPVPEDA